MRPGHQHKLRNHLFAAIIAGLFCTTNAFASSYADDADGLELQPGQYTWLADASQGGAGPVTMLVNLRDQRAYLYRDGQRIAVTTVSTGVPGHDTPIGVFPIMGKQRVYHSKKYDNAPMPFMQRLTQWGHAVHAGQVRAGPASHGCVRLPAEFAKALFSLTSPGDLVVISQDDSVESLARAGVDGRIAPMLGAPADQVQRIAESVLPAGYPLPGIVAGGAPTAF